MRIGDLSNVKENVYSGFYMEFKTWEVAVMTAHATSTSGPEMTASFSQ